VLEQGEAHAEEVADVGDGGHGEAGAHPVCRQPARRVKDFFCGGGPHGATVRLADKKAQSKVRGVVRREVAPGWPVEKLLLIVCRLIVVNRTTLLPHETRAASTWFGAETVRVGTSACPSGAGVVARSVGRPRRPAPHLRGIGGASRTERIDRQYGAACFCSEHGCCGAIGSADMNVRTKQKSCRLQASPASTKVACCVEFVDSQ